MTDNEQPDPVKEYLFSYITNSPKIREMIAQKRFGQAIRDITENCYGAIATMADRPHALGVMATGILHYTLTQSMIHSQRKIECKGVMLDIVIPDLHTLQHTPEDALLLYISKSSDPSEIARDISRLCGIQPVIKNLWVVLSDAAIHNHNTKYDAKHDAGSNTNPNYTYRMPDGRALRSFVLSKQHNTFSSIISEITMFLKGTGNTSRLKIVPP